MLTDEEIVRWVRAGEARLFELIMRRHDQRVYRAARAILRENEEAEDGMQDAYVRAFAHLHEFEGGARFSTWLMRIAVNEALARARRRAFEFHLSRCDRVGAAVRLRLGIEPSKNSGGSGLGSL